MEHFYSGGFVCADTLTREADASGLKLEGEIGCKGNIIVDVFKLIALAEPGAAPEDVNVLVQTFRYAHNARPYPQRSARRGRWNAAWHAFKTEHPNASLEQVYRHLGRMLYEFELTGPVEPYWQRLPPPASAPMGGCVE